LFEGLQADVTTLELFVSAILRGSLSNAKFDVFLYSICDKIFSVVEEGVKGDAAYAESDV
jgi:hypothetical protein